VLLDSVWLSRNKKITYLLMTWNVYIVTIIIHAKYPGGRPGGKIVPHAAASLLRLSRLLAESWINAFMRHFITWRIPACTTITTISISTTISSISSSCSSTSITPLNPHIGRPAPFLRIEIDSDDTERHRHIVKPELLCPLVS